MERILIIMPDKIEIKGINGNEERLLQTAN